LTSKVDTLDVYLDMITLLKQQLNDAQAREQAALQRDRVPANAKRSCGSCTRPSAHATTASWRPRALPTTPVPVCPRSSAQAPVADRGDIRRCILALVREHPEELCLAHMRQLLDIEKDLGATMKAMLRDGLLKRVTHGQYTAID
jgi:hypothetical protein